MAYCTGRDYGKKPAADGLIEGGPGCGVRPARASEDSFADGACGGDGCEKEEEGEGDPEAVRERVAE